MLAAGLEGWRRGFGGGVCSCCGVGSEVVLVGGEGLLVAWVWPKMGRAVLVGVSVLLVGWVWPSIGRVALVGVAGWLAGSWRELVEGAAAGLWFAASR